MSEQFRIELDNGGYTLILDDEHRLKALRNGLEWRDLIGDNLVLALAHRILELEKEVKDARSEIIRLEFDVDFLNRELSYHG